MWVNNRDAGELRRHRTHYDVTATCALQYLGYARTRHQGLPRPTHNRYWCLVVGNPCLQNLAAWTNVYLVIKIKGCHEHSRYVRAFVMLISGIFSKIWVILERLKKQKKQTKYVTQTLKDASLCNVETLRALRYKSSYLFETPPNRCATRFGEYRGFKTTTMGSPWHWVSNVHVMLYSTVINMLVICKTCWI